MAIMFKSKMSFTLLIALPLLLMVLLAYLQMPTDVHAGPLAGFTPSPPDPPDDDDDDGSSNPTGLTTPDDSGSDALPPDYVYVQMDRCNLSCSAGVAHSSDQPAFQSLAAADADDWLGSLLAPLNDEAPTVEILAPVHLVHEGSGWIAAAVLSDRHSSRVSVPYPGYWEVWLVGSPELVAAETLDTSGTNMLELETYLADRPVSLGVVEANTGGPQLIKCPIACVIETPPAELPQTGNDQMHVVFLLKLLLMAGISLALIGLLMRLVAHHTRPQS
jgi:hypothetical protein